MAGFGMVGLISVIPITMVILLTFLLSVILGDNFVITETPSTTANVAGIFDITVTSLLLAVRAIASIFIFLYLFLRCFLKEKETPLPRLILGVVSAIDGLLLFNFSLSVGLAEPAFNIMGQQVEDVTQGAFKKWLFGQVIVIGVGVGAAGGATVFSGRGMGLRERLGPLELAIVSEKRELLVYLM